MEPSRFTYQENQYYGECLPCTAAVFNQLVDDAKVAWKIEMRQAVERAISEGASLDAFAKNADFKKFCAHKQMEPSFGRLTLPQRIQLWAASLKSSLPCFIFGVQAFKASPKVDKEGNPALDYCLRRRWPYRSATSHHPRGWSAERCNS